MADEKNKVLLVGAGKMGLAMLKGWLDSPHAHQYRFSILDPYPSDEVFELLRTNKFGVCKDPNSLVIKEMKVDAAVLAVKPQMYEAVVTELGKSITPKFVVSIMAGVRASELAISFPRSKIVRSMPNLPAQIGEGMCAGFSFTSLDITERWLPQFLLGSTGKFEWVDDESQIDAVTAISGSGPAYVFLLAEVLAKIAEQIGLDPRNVETFANQTIIGAAELLKQSQDGAATLRRNVTSPGGTTEAALKVLMREGNGLEELLLEAVQAAKKRSEELSK